MRFLAIFFLCTFFPTLAQADAAAAVGLIGGNGNQGIALGSVVDEANLEDARTKAVETCRRFAGAPKAAQFCTVVLTFKNECFAVAFDPKPGPRGYGWATGPTKATAEERAVAQCRLTADPGRRDFCAIDKEQTKCDSTAN